MLLSSIALTGRYLNHQATVKIGALHDGPA
jgi:hypothetical protein